MRRLFFPLLIIGLIYFYLGWSLDSTFAWIGLAVMLGLILTFPFVRLRPIVSQITFLAMGFLSCLIVFVVIKDLLRLTGIIIPAYWIYLLSTLAVIIGSLIAHRGPTIVKLRLPITDLPKDLEGFRIVQISDLHVGPTIGKKYVEKVVATANELQADLIALTGDIGDGAVENYANDISPMGKLQSKYGVYYVLGNHEYYWNANEWINVMKNLNAIVLMNRGQKIRVKDAEVLVGGVTDPAGRPGPDLNSVNKDGADAHFKLLLSHRPGLADEAANLGFHLFLAGHTHGGQFFPWTVAVRFAHKHFIGHHLVNGMWLNVNTGTGSWGPFLRLGTTSEITLIELFRSNSY